LWQNGASYEAKVSTDSLQEVVYEKSINTNMNDLDSTVDYPSDSLASCIY